jgi:hypothetical protein
MLTYSGGEAGIGASRRRYVSPRQSAERRLTGGWVEQMIPCVRQMPMPHVGYAAWSNLWLL